MKRQLPPTALVIFGVTGDLSRRKLLPALYHLQAQNRLPEQFAILGVFHRPPNLDSLFQQVEIQLLREHGSCDAKILAALRGRTRAIQMENDEPADYDRLRTELDKLDHSERTHLDRLYYLAIPPSSFPDVVNNLAAAGLNRTDDGGHTGRILVEKPFGHDLESARKLIALLSSHFEESQVYRIDHYLAKETAQNILAFRFNNPLIEGIWSREFIDHIQITMAETIDIQGRARFYESMGAMRDIIQSHLMQLMALILMERPGHLTSRSIHTEKLRLLKSLEPVQAQDVPEVAARGQYAGYTTAVNNPQSTTETYAAVKLEAANTRWRGVPVLLRTGKALAAGKTEIVLVFKDRGRHHADDNHLVIRIQPNEGISLKLLAKRPGFTSQLQPVLMNFRYNESFEGSQPDAYQRVLVDAIRGDQSLFATSDEVIASWEFLQPILDAWQNDRSQPQTYQPGTWGPASATNLAAGYGCNWIN